MITLPDLGAALAQRRKDLGLLYSGEADVRVAPIYDMLSIRIYERYLRPSSGSSSG